MKLAEKEFTIVSDDIRQEVGGKHSIMGIYFDKIMLREFPAILPKIAFTVFLENLKRVLDKAELRLFTPNTDPVVFNVGKPPNQKVGGNAMLTFVLSPFKVEAPGEAKIEIRLGDEKEPSIVHRFTVEKAEKPKKEK